MCTFVGAVKTLDVGVEFVVSAHCRTDCVAWAAADPAESVVVPLLELADSGDTSTFKEVSFFLSPQPVTVKAVATAMRQASTLGMEQMARSVMKFS